MASTNNISLKFAKIVSQMANKEWGDGAFVREKCEL